MFPFLLMFLPILLFSWTKGKLPYALYMSKDSLILLGKDSLILLDIAYSLILLFPVHCQFSVHCLFSWTLPILLFPVHCLFSYSLGQRAGPKRTKTRPKRDQHGTKMEPTSNGGQTRPNWDQNRPRDVPREVTNTWSQKKPQNY